MEEKNEIQKPFIVEIDEVKTEIVQCINNALQIHKVPCYFVDMILTEVCAQIKDGAKQELEMAKKQVDSEGVA